MVNGQLVTVAGSANVDWNMVISDPNDTRIDWPKTKPRDTGLPEAQDNVSEFGIVLHPMVFLDKRVGELKLDGLNGYASRTPSILPFYKIETDAAGNPVLARMILTIGMNYNLFEEGGTLDEQSFNDQILENYYIYQALQENVVYYVGISPIQTEGYKKLSQSIDGYQGILAGDEIQEVIMGLVKNNNDMVLARVNLLIIKKTN